MLGIQIPSTDQFGCFGSQGLDVFGLLVVPSGVLENRLGLVIQEPLEVPFIDTPVMSALGAGFSVIAPHGQPMSVYY